MDELDRNIIAVLERIPDKNPDDSLWVMYVGTEVYTKKYILDNYETDESLRILIRKLIVNTGFYKNSNLSSKQTVKKGG